MFLLRFGINTQWKNCRARTVDAGWNLFTAFCRVVQLVKTYPNYKLCNRECDGHFKKKSMTVFQHVAQEVEQVAGSIPGSSSECRGDPEQDTQP